MPIGETFEVFRFAFLGDSIIQELGSYQSSIEHANWKNANLYGVSGNTMAQIYARVGSVPSNTTHLFVEGGTNDLFGLGDETGIIPNYTNILEYFKNTAMRVIIVGIAPIDYTKLLSYWGGSVGKLTPTYINAAHLDLITLCGSYKNAVPALASMLGNQDGLTRDGIHNDGLAYYQNLYRMVGRYAK